MDNADPGDISDLVGLFSNRHEDLCSSLNNTRSHIHIDTQIHPPTKKYKEKSNQ